jgi:myo-inositol-1(or 4)-monophosphatase
VSLDPLVAVTLAEAVVQAGAAQVAALGHDLHIRKKGDIDLVTEVDLAVERRFRATVAERFPDHEVLGEEYSSAADARSAARCRWIFDPVDGTTNFAHGLPIFCASLAFEEDGVVQAGAVYDPTRRELFTASRGEGAFLNGRPLRVSSEEVLRDALLCTGFPYDVHEAREEMVALFSEFLGRARAVRRLGSAAIDLCYVAAGRLDGFWEGRLQPWDTAAGAVIVEEAGGVVSTWTGAAWTPYDAHVIATNGRVHADMVAVIQHHKARVTAKGRD